MKISLNDGTPFLPTPFSFALCTARSPPPFYQPPFSINRFCYKIINVSPSALQLLIQCFLSVLKRAAFLDVARRVYSGVQSICLEGKGREANNLREGIFFNHLLCFVVLPLPSSLLSFSVAEKPDCCRKSVVSAPRASVFLPQTMFFSFFSPKMIIAPPGSRVRNYVK